MLNALVAQVVELEHDGIGLAAVTHGCVTK